MSKKWIAFGFLFGFSAFVMFSMSTGCGQQAETAATTTTTIAASSAVAISGTTATGVSSLGLRTFAASLGTAEVKISYCTTGSDEVIELARGITSPDGTYEVLVAVASLEGLKATSGYVSNLIVTVSKEGTVIGCVIPSVSPEAGKKAYSPTATSGNYAKQKMALKCFKKGMNPKNFDFSSNIDQKFSGETVKDYDASKLDAVANSIKSGEDAADEIGAGLGISTENIQKMKNKGMELYKTYIEPIERAAFENKTPPDRATMDTAFASMESAMMTYAKEIGITEQQLSDFKSMKDKTIETQMGQEGAIKDDPGFCEAKRRMMGNKLVTMFRGQFKAAKDIAEISPVNDTSKKSFAVSSESIAAYNKFIASEEVIVAVLTTMMNNVQMSDPRNIPDYLRTNFFDAYVFPPATGKPSVEAGFDPASMEAMMNSYKNNRIMVYFMQTFLTGPQRMTYFSSQESNMQPIFERRFQLHRIDRQTGSPEATAAYYMGPDFWATNPTPEQIQARLALYNTALEAAMDNNAALKSIFAAAGFSDSQATTILKAFRILMSPPDMMM